MEQKTGKILMACLLILSMAVLDRETTEYVNAVTAVNVLRGTENAVGDEAYTVVIDAGHGGDDPGKIGINGVDGAIAAIGLEGALCGHRIGTAEEGCLSRAMVESTEAHDGA